MTPESENTSLFNVGGQQPGAASVKLDKRRIGIVAGGGALPVAVAEGMIAAGYDPFILGLEGSAGCDIQRFPHAYVHLGQVARLIRTLKRERCVDIVFVGSLRRPNILKLKLDYGFFYHVFTLLRLLKGGDDTVLRGVARFFESQGFSVHAAHTFAPRLLATTGVMSRQEPDSEALEDMRLGFRVVQALGALDIGQAAVVAHGYVLGVEAAEGTDALLRRCGDLNRWGKGNKRKGVLVKAPKPSQDLRLDLPTIGPVTVQLAAAAGLAGIAVAAGAVLIAEQDQVVENIDRHGLFLYGATPEETSTP